MPVAAGDLRQAQRWRAVRHEYGDLLAEQQQRIIDDMIRMYRERKTDPLLYYGKAGELSRIRDVMSKMERNIIDAEREVEHGI